MIFPSPLYSLLNRDTYWHQKIDLKVETGRNQPVYENAFLLWLLNQLTRRLAYTSLRYTVRAKVPNNIDTGLYLPQRHSRNQVYYV